MARFDINTPITTREPTVPVDGELPIGRHLFRLEVIDREGRRSTPNDAIVDVQRIVVSPVVTPVVSPVLTPGVSPVVSPVIAPVVGPRPPLVSPIRPTPVIITRDAASPPPRRSRKRTKRGRTKKEKP